MRNPTRRNRNIGTAKQGHGQNNQLAIPWPAVTSKTFYERLDRYQVIQREIKGQQFTFVVENTRKQSFHACTIDDICKVLTEIPIADFGELELIVLRQPKRKEETLNPVWGRLIYSYEFENDYYQPTIILEAFDLTKKFKWGKKLSLAAQQELERLKKDGHPIKLNKRYYEAEYHLAHVRATQLYRTLLHEFGHHVHYQRVIIEPLKSLKQQIDRLSTQIDEENLLESHPTYLRWSKLDEEYEDKKDKLRTQYFAISSQEKEVFAHTYADNLKRKMEEKGLLPFDRMVAKEKMLLESLKIEDFVPLEVSD